MKEPASFVDVTLKSLRKGFHHELHGPRKFKYSMMDYAVGRASHDDCLELVSQVQKYGSYVKQIQNVVTSLKERELMQY